jgi:hypothetical protein
VAGRLPPSWHPHQWWRLTSSFLVKWLPTWALHTADSLHGYVSHRFGVTNIITQSVISRFSQILSSFVHVCVILL